MNSHVHTLEWIGKEKVINHHQDVPFRLLEKKYTYNAESSENMIIHGDNLLALKSLLPQYEGRVDCIYIDPPYNTGNEKWVYNDNVNDPRIKKWLGEVVGAEGEDLSRHDKWLCMMYPRLKLLYKLLSDHGAIFISIDDNEYSNLKLLCDEIFGSRCFISNIVWQKKTGASDSRGIANITEYILVYVKNDNVVGEIFNRNTEAFDIARYRFTDEFVERRGNYYLDSLDRGSVRYSDALNYPIIAPDGTEIYPNGRSKFENDGWTWKWSKEKVLWGIKNGFIVISKSSAKQCGWAVRYKIYLKVDNEDNLIEKSSPYKNVINDVLNANAAADIKSIFAGKTAFQYSKPFGLIKTLLGYVIKRDSIVLDSFAGSGTTAHAVLDLNKKDSGNRKFILVEMMDYAETITAERVKRVIVGYGEGSKAVEGLGGDFSYYELGAPLFDENKNINEEVPAEEIRKYIYYMETKQPPEVNTDDNEYFLGKHNDTAYYFYYEKARATTLNTDFLSTIKTKASGYLIYADVCALSKAMMEKYGITFKKIPRDIQKL